MLSQVDGSCIHTTQSILPAPNGLRGFRESETMRAQRWMGKERGVDLGGVGVMMWSKWHCLDSQRII